jgi:hypothetical protein
MKITFTKVIKILSHEFVSFMLVTAIHTFIIICEPQISKEFPL